MPKGLKQTSSLIVIGGQVQESAANTFTEARVDLQLNPLDNEVFVVQAVNLDITAPDASAGTPSASTGVLTTTSQASMPTLDETAVIARTQKEIRSDAVIGVGFEQTSMETPPSALEYIGIIATNDFFLSCIGFNNTNAKSMNVKVYGYRARADSSIYAALVQSEVLSS